MGSEKTLVEKVQARVRRGGGVVSFEVVVEVIVEVIVVVVEVVRVDEVVDAGVDLAIHIGRGDDVGMHTCVAGE